MIEDCRPTLVRGTGEQSPARAWRRWRFPAGGSLPGQTEYADWQGLVGVADEAPATAPEAGALPVDVAGSAAEG